MENNELIESFDESFYRDDLVDLGADVGDICIDLISENGVIDKIPIIGLLHGGYKAYKSISTARLIKKMGRFLFSTADISPEKKRQFVEDLSEEINDHGSEFLLDYINRVDNINKIDVLSNIVHAKVNGAIDCVDFIVLCKIVENLPYSLFKLIRKYTTKQYMSGETDVLFGLGLLYISSICPKENKFSLNRNGYLLLRYGMGTNIMIPDEYPLENSAYAVLR